MAESAAETISDAVGRLRDATPSVEDAMSRVRDAAPTIDLSAGKKMAVKTAKSASSNRMLMAVAAVGAALAALVWWMQR